MATLFTRFGNTEKRGFIAGDLLSSHPDSGKRAAEAKLHARPGRPPAMEGDAWKLARAVCESDDD
jgi:predicted Zn-dependent protease